MSKAAKRAFKVWVHRDPENELRRYGSVIAYVVTSGSVKMTGLKRATLTIDRPKQKRTKACKESSLVAWGTHLVRQKRKAKK